MDIPSREKLRTLIVSGKIRAFIFDWGNTLVDYPLQSFSEQILFIQEFLLNFNPPILPPNLELEVLNGILQAFNQEAQDGAVFPFQKRLNHFFSQHGMSETLSYQTLSLLEQHLCQRIFQQAKLFKDAVLTCKKLKLMGYKIGILSNTPWGTDPKLWLTEVNNHGFCPDLSGLSDVVVFCGDVGYRKPNPVIFQHCLERLGVSPSESVFVGDNLHSDVMGSQNAGLFPVWIQRELSDLSPPFDCLIIRSLSELTEI
ncbi:hypothetical protein BZZ01_13930 [Nostocales cyanobacterium HT-58-2]|nr:hypothetical protein BZZ01_13930 [Nostocales cyanobacterium HT-58-2]